MPFDIDHIEPGVHPLRPRLLGGPPPGPWQCPQRSLVDGLQRSPRRSHRRHLAEELGLARQGAQIGEASCPHRPPTRPDPLAPGPDRDLGGVVLRSAPSPPTSRPPNPAHRPDRTTAGPPHAPPPPGPPWSPTPAVATRYVSLWKCPPGCEPVLFSDASFAYQEGIFADPVPPTRPVSAKPGASAPGDTPGAQTSRPEASGSLSP